MVYSVLWVMQDFYHQQYLGFHIRPWNLAPNPTDSQTYENLGWPPQQPYLVECQGYLGLRSLGFYRQRH